MFFSVRLLISFIMDLSKRNQCTGTTSIKKMIRFILSFLTVLLEASGESSSSRRPHTFTGSVMFADGDASSSVTSPGAPHFAELIRNVTVPLGREAVLSCVINNLAEYKVGWLRADDQTILSLHRRVVTHNPRVSVTHDESRTWNLHIRQIKESDQGCYMCQINTAVMKKQLGCIQVQVPPDIVDDRSTSDVTVNEGDNVTLTCTATGKPTPRIVWRREDGQKIVVFRPMASPSASNHNNHHAMKTSSGGSIMPANATAATIDDAIVPGLQTHHQHQHQGIAVPMTRERSKEVEAYHGETLRLYRVTRQMMAAYMCIASNDVPPAVSKRVPLNVNFPPLVTSSMNVVGALLGTDVRLTCQVESHPPSINYWMKGRQQDQHNTILPSAKYSIDGERGGSSSYKTSMSLIIHNFQPQDKSAYICVAANSLGTAEASIQIYEVARATFGPTLRSATSTLDANDFIINDEDEDDEDEEDEDDGHQSSKGRQHKIGVTSQKVSTNKKKHSRHQKHETSLSPMSMSPSDEYRDRKQEQRDETANQINQRRGSSSGAVPRIRAAQSFVRFRLVVFLLFVFAV
ncbi:cell adhesion molecule-related/down-regulated by oncogenes isoform X3 [Daphnia magna]|uniref:cell adhesion molecule-related/down-regulated by oncogenes isoform X3 n=1 Tax=Daphnia magna TaxID=35525 RepID=UPI001E1BC801|nr:cell adhesion molecule-related/down-regulated by oncogenes isoform X3 [Daphnia magna]